MVSYCLNVEMLVMANLLLCFYLGCIASSRFFNLCTGMFGVFLTTSVAS